MAEPTPQAQSGFREELRRLWQQTVGQRPGQAAAPAPAATPVVTPGAAQTPAERPPLLETLRESVRDMVSPEPSTADRLAALGAGMLTNPRSRYGFFGDLAAGMQAQQQFDARAREERRKSAETQAKIIMADAEQRYKENPDSWQARAALMKAEADMRAAEAATRRANQEQRDRVVGQQRDADGNLYNVHESGRVTRVGGEGGPSFVDPERSPEARRYAAWSQSRENLESRLRATAPSITESPEQREARIQNDLRAWLQNNPRPRAPWEQRPDPNAPAAAAAPAQNENRTRIDFNTGRPL